MQICFQAKNSSIPFIFPLFTVLMCGLLFFFFVDHNKTLYLKSEIFSVLRVWCLENSIKAKDVWFCFNSGSCIYLFYFCFYIAPRFPVLASAFIFWVIFTSSDVSIFISYLVSHINFISMEEKRMGDACPFENQWNQGTGLWRKSFFPLHILFWKHLLCLVE